MIEIITIKLAQNKSNKNKHRKSQLDTNKIIN